MSKDSLKLLSLKAETSEDLSVVSGSVQDSILRVKGIIYKGTARSLTLGLQRYRREIAKPSRITSALRFDSVLSVKSSGIDTSNQEAFVVLLSIIFEESDKPAGIVTLNFSGGAQIIAEVECLDAMLSDQGLPWFTKSIPNHDD